MSSKTSRRDLENLASQIGTDKKVSNLYIVRNMLNALRPIQRDLSFATGLQNKGVSLSEITSTTITELNVRKHKLEVARVQLKKSKTVYSVLKEECTAIREALKGLEQTNEDLLSTNMSFQLVHEDANNTLTAALKREPDQDLERDRISTAYTMLGLVQEVAGELENQKKDSASAIADKDRHIEIISDSKAEKQRAANEAQAKANEAIQEQTKANKQVKELKEEAERDYEKKTAAIKLRSEFNSIWAIIIEFPHDFLNKDDSKQAIIDIWRYFCGEFWSEMSPGHNSSDWIFLKERFPVHLPGTKMKVSAHLDEIFDRASKLQDELLEHNFSAHIGPVKHVDNDLQRPAVFICMDHGSSGCFGYSDSATTMNGLAA